MSSTRFMPYIYHDWENMEIIEFNFLSTKELQKNFCENVLKNFTPRIIAHLKNQLLKIRRAIIARLSEIYGMSGGVHVRSHAIHSQVLQHVNYSFNKHFQMA